MVRLRTLISRLISAFVHLLMLFKTISLLLSMLLTTLSQVVPLTTLPQVVLLTTLPKVVLLTTLPQVNRPLAMRKDGIQTRKRRPKVTKTPVSIKVSPEQISSGKSF